MLTIKGAERKKSETEGNYNLISSPLNISAGDIISENSKITPTHKVSQQSLGKLLLQSCGVTQKQF